MEAGAAPADVINGLAGLQAVKGRMNIKRGLNGAVVIDDSYNASPASFRAALAVLAARPGLRIVVAGDMGELGPDSATLHAELGRLARELGIEHFIGCGSLCQKAVAAFGANGTWVGDCDAAVAALLPLLSGNASVLVKGSRSAGMERVVNQI